MQTMKSRFFATLQNAGMPKVPDEFSVSALHQEIPKAILAEIDMFIDVFDRVTTRSAWQKYVTENAAQFFQQKRPEICFFSAWDLHLPPEQPESWQMIEFNDNGSGFLFAELINRAFYETFDLAQNKMLEAPPELSVFNAYIASMVESEAKAFFGKYSPELLLILDDNNSLQQGMFRQELQLLRKILQRRGWAVGITSPAELFWNGKHLYWHGKVVDFIINRSTDFLWQADCFCALRAAYQARQVYVAPNPFTYITRSEKRLLEFLSQPDWDHKLGINPQERIWTPLVKQAC